jgi:hypothetical protein
MHRAAVAGLVDETYAQLHAADAVLFKRVGPDQYEYRVKRSILGYAGIPWLVARRTNVKLIDHCQKSGNEVCFIQVD